MATDVSPIILPGEAVTGVRTVADGTAQSLYARGTTYGDGFVYPVGSQRQNLAGEGSYWVYTSAAPGTTIAYGSGGTQTSFLDTVAFLVVKNNNPSSSKKRVFLDYLKILVSGTVPAAATSTQFAVKCDTGSRTPTANFTGPTTPVGANSTSVAFGTQVWCPSANTITVPAVQSARVVGRGSLRQVISVTLDEYVLKFGSDDLVGLTNGAGAGRFGGNCAAVILQPQEFAIVHLWQPSATTSPLTCEIELTGWER